jgi:hypothetical protein
MSTELALRAFEADASYSAALAEFQATVPDGIHPIQAARQAAALGFCWFSRPIDTGFVEVRLRHSGGADSVAEGPSVPELLAGLLGLVWPGDAQAAEPEEKCDSRIKCPSEQSEPEPEQPAEPEPLPVQVAAESLAAATSGTVVAEPVADPEPDPTTPLTAEQKAVAINMIKSLTADQRQSFTISFRDAFRVERSVKAIAPVIQQLQHLHFCDRWSIENAGGVAP